MHTLENNVLTIKAGSKIPSGAFEGNQTIHKAIIKERVSVGEGAFQSCRALTELTFSDGVKSIDLGAFWYCIGITELTIPGGVSINDGAFLGCRGIEKLSIRPGANIGQGAFNYCTAIDEITVPGQYDMTMLKKSLQGSTAVTRKVKLIKEPLTFQLPNLMMSEARESIKHHAFKKGFISVALLCANRLDKLEQLPKLPIELWWIVLSNVYYTYIKKRETTVNLKLMTKQETSSLALYKNLEEAFSEIRLYKKERLSTLQEKEDAFLNMHLPNGFKHW